MPNTSSDEGKSTKPAGRALRLKTRASQTPQYALISLIVFICCVAVLLLLIEKAEKLSRFDLLDPVCYLVFGLMGLAATSFLFGVLESSASWEGKVLGGKLKLSGSIVGAALFVFVGHYFLPKTTFFPLTVYVRGEGGPQDMVLRNTGRVFLQLGPEKTAEIIGENGQAVFPRVPGEYRGQEVPGWVESEDYEAPKTNVTLTGNNVDLIVKKKIKKFELAGTVLDERGEPLFDVRIVLPKYHLGTNTNEEGRFEFRVIAARQESVDLIASKDRFQSKRLSPTLGDSDVNFALTREK